MHGYRGQTGRVATDPTARDSSFPQPDAKCRPRGRLISTPRFDRQIRAERCSGRNETDDTRTPFQRDRDRILFTAAFRRLAGVTQVVSSEGGQIFHNRMTPSLEVAEGGGRV